MWKIAYEFNSYEKWLSNDCVIRMEDRNEYMSALEKASSENNLDDFIKIVEKAVNRSLDTYLYILQ